MTLRAGDRVIATTQGGIRYRSDATVVRVDRVEPGFVRVIQTRKGRVNGKVVVGDFQDMYHPNHDVEVER